MIKMLKSKIHRPRLTKVDLDYEGSISIDHDLLDAAHIRPFESVHVWNVSTGMRLETYAIPAPAGSGEIGLNGAAARGAAVGDVVIIATWQWVDEKADIRDPALVFIGDGNRIKSVAMGGEVG